MADHNSFASVRPGDLKTAAAAAEFVEKITFKAIQAEALRIGTRCLLDGLGLFVAGSEEHTVQFLAENAEQMGGRTDALLLSRGKKSSGADGGAVFGDRRARSRLGRQPGECRSGARLRAVTHPTIPPFSSALVMAQKLGGIDGKTFMLAFLTGFEVECKISEWMLPQHYVKGMHSSGTVGTFGAYAAAAKLLD